MRRITTLLALVLTSPHTHGQASTLTLGPQFDPARDGHGIDIVRSGDTFLIGLYTYDQSGEPEWMAAQGSLSNGVFAAPLLRFHNDGSNTQPRVSSRTVGELRLTPGPTSNACQDGTPRGDPSRLAELRFDIEGQTHLWCVVPLLPDGSSSDSSMNGTWWGGPDDSGWGLTTYFVNTVSAHSAVQVLYAYDAAGEPRWSIAQGSYDSFNIDTRWSSPRGYCRSCAIQPLQPRDAGPLKMRLTTPLTLDGLDNQLDMQAIYPGSAGGVWNRAIRLQRSSDLFPTPRTVATRDGLVEGRVDRAETVTWQGIPYVAPSVGELRLRAPQPASSRQSVLQANSFGPVCPQRPAQGSFEVTESPQSEDCLTLNIWAPEASVAYDDLPVMIWIHGGGHVQGSAAQLLRGQPVYDGSQFARRDVVFVSINYRLGALGYTAVRELIGEHPDQPAAGNYGLLDQIAALRWVHDNIAQFGGDPNNVTLFGESAGGVSVCALMATPMAEPYFARAITQSGPCTSSMSRLLLTNGSQEAAISQGERLKQGLGCTDGDVAACLRSRSADDFVSAGQGSVAFEPGERYGEIIDGFVLPTSLRDALRTGTAAQKPLMIGVNEDETNSLIPTSQRPASAAAYEALVRSRLPAIGEAILAQYPSSAYSPVWQAWTAINTDIGFTCPSARAARDHATQGNDVYAYYLTQTLPDRVELGAYHALDIGFLFTDFSQFDSGIQTLARDMKDRWVSFALDGVPDVAGLPTWPRHPTNSQLGLELKASGSVSRQGYDDAFCAFWARFVDL